MSTVYQKYFESLCECYMPVQIQIRLCTGENSPFCHLFLPLSVYFSVLIKPTELTKTYMISCIKS